MYPDHLHKWFQSGQYWLNVGPLVAGKFSVIGVSVENTWKEWHEIWPSSLSWPHTELIWFWPDFGSLVTKKINEIADTVILKKTHKRNGPKFGMQVYHHHRQNRWEFCHGLIIFLLFVYFRLRGMDQICGFKEFPGERMGGLAWKGRA